MRSRLVLLLRPLHPQVNRQAMDRTTQISMSSTILRCVMAALHSRRTAPLGKNQIPVVARSQRSLVQNTLVASVLCSLRAIQQPCGPVASDASASSRRRHCFHLVSVLIDELVIHCSTPPPRSATGACWCTTLLHHVHNNIISSSPGPFIQIEHKQATRHRLTRLLPPTTL